MEIAIDSKKYVLLPPAYVVRGKVLFSQVSVCQHLGGVPTFRMVGGTYSGLDGGGGGGTYLWPRVEGYLLSSGQGGTYLWPGWGGYLLSSGR